MKQENKTNNNGFKIPKDYFKNIENRIFEKLSEENLLNNNEFLVPKNYFEKVEHEIFNKLNLETKTKKTKIISLWQNIAKISVAASFILMLSLLFINKKSETIKITNIDVEYWLNENIDQLDTNLIANLFNYTENEDILNFEDTDIFTELDGINIEMILDEIETEY